MANRDTDRLFDVRTVRRNVRAGLVERSDYESFLLGLADRAADAVPLNADDHDDDEYNDADYDASSAAAAAADDDDDDLDDDDIDATGPDGSDDDAADEPL